MQTIRELIGPLPEEIKNNFIDEVIRQYGTSEVLDTEEQLQDLKAIAEETGLPFDALIAIKTVISFSATKLGVNYWRRVCNTLESSQT